MEIAFGAASIVLIGLTHFANVERKAKAQRREESARRVDEVVKYVQVLLTPAGGNHGPHLGTLQEAGIRALSDAEIRTAMELIAQRTSIALSPAEWSELAGVNLSKVFNAVHQRVNLSGGMSALRTAITQLRSEGVDVTRESRSRWRSLFRV